MPMYQVGSLYNPNRTTWPEAGEYNYRENTHELRMFFTKLTSQDIAAVRSGPARFGLFIEGEIIFFLYEFGSAFPLSDAPYTIHMVPQEDRTLPPLPNTLEGGQGVALNILLMHSETGRIAAVRLIGLGHELSVALLDAIHKQAEMPFSQATYDRHLAKIYERYPNPQALWTRAIQYRVPARS